MRKIAVVVVGFMILFGVSGCEKKSALEGKVVDGKEQPLAGIKVMAKQIQPIKGYESFETTTGSDGGFRFEKLFPMSEYELTLLSDSWSTEGISIKVESGPEGQTKLLPKPMMIRYIVSKDGVISDSRTGLQWFAGPDQDTNWDTARNWTAGLAVAGGGWRMPARGELKALYEKGVGERNIDPAFKMTGLYVWSGEPTDSSSAWIFDFNDGEELWDFRIYGFDIRALAVRARR